MHLLLALFKYNLKISFQYRWSSLVSVFMDPFLLILYIHLLRAIYDHNNTTTLMGYNLNQMIWYFGATKFFFYLVVSHSDKQLSENILSGKLITKMIKPVSVVTMEFTEAVSSRLTAFIFEFIPNFLIYCILIPPTFMTFETLSKYLILTVFAFILFFLLSFLLGIIAFRWENADGLFQVKTIIISLFAGAALPIEFFPEFLQNIIQYLPFQYMFYIPIRIFLNMPEAQESAYFLNALSILLIWIIVFQLLVSICWKKYSKSFSAVG